MKTEILVVCTHPEILKTILRLINQQETWNAGGAANLSEALESCHQQKFDLVLIGAGLTEQEENELGRYLKELKPPVAVVKHYGGGSGLLYAEIFQALTI